MRCNYFLCLILLCLFSCKKNTQNKEKFITQNKEESMQNKGVEFSNVYTFSKSCNDVNYVLNLNTKNDSLVISRNNERYSIPIKRLKERIDNFGWVEDFSIDCDCNFNGIKINYKHFKLNTEIHYLFFESKNIYIDKAFDFYSNKHEETLYGFKFYNKTRYSYDDLNLEKKYSKIINFYGFQEENYDFNINDYTNEMKNLYKQKNYNEIKLKGDTYVLNYILKYVAIEEATLNYNNVAFYLEQSGAFKEAIFILEKIISKFPERTVAYLNLGDAYWGNKNTTKAKEAYTTFITQMTKKGKEAKIPKRVLEK